MTLEELAAIEQRLSGEKKPIGVGDKVVIESFNGGEYTPYARGTVTKCDDDALWLDDKPTKYWLVDAYRNDPTPNDDIKALLTELKETHKRLWARAATAEGDAAFLRKLLKEAREIIVRYVPGPLTTHISVSYFLQQSKEALNSVPVEAKE